MNILENMRPNIRIEIQNDAIEPMEVEENEEGEIEDSDTEETAKNRPNINPNISLITAPINEASPPLASTKIKSNFVTGINLLDKKEQEKLQERAKRFQLKPDEIRNFTDEHLNNLYISLGINNKNEPNIKFETIHMRGVQDLSTEDVLEYFISYAPVSIEWIEDNACTVVWSDRISAARALHFISKAVKGMPVRDDQSYFDAATTQEPEEIDRSILLINKNREVELQEDPPAVLNQIHELEDTVDISIITATIPPGYWRLGVGHPKAKCILLRFGLKTDQQPYKTEQFSWYYKKQGKASSTKPVKSQGIFGRNKDMNRVGSNSSTSSSSKTENPWSVLAKNWDEDAQFRERDPIIRVEEPKLDIKNPVLRTRLGAKRKETESEGEEEEEKPKKSKVPRMKMYADEEEEKIKRKKLLQTIKHTFEQISENEQKVDLRKVLSANSKRTLPTKEPPMVDLGATLKNRSKKMVFEVKTEYDESSERKQERRHRSDEGRDRRRYERARVRRHRDRLYEDEDDDDQYAKPKSKVAVVIRTQKKPLVASAVASTVWSRINRRPSSSDNSDSNEMEEAEANEEEEEEDESSSEHSKSTDRVPFERAVHRKETSRPGFKNEEGLRHRLNKNPLKIEINNDHYKNV